MTLEVQRNALLNYDPDENFSTNNDENFFTNNDENLNFGQLLHPLEPSIKSSVRRYEKLIKSRVSLSFGVLFNETYIYKKTMNKLDNTWKNLLQTVNIS